MRLPRLSETFLLSLIVVGALLFLVARTPPPPDPFAGETLASWTGSATEEHATRNDTSGEARLSRTLRTTNPQHLMRSLQWEAVTSGWTLSTTDQLLGDTPVLYAQKTLPDGTRLSAAAKTQEGATLGAGKLALLLTATND